MFVLEPFRKWKSKIFVLLGVILLYKQICILTLSINVNIILYHDRGNDIHWMYFTLLYDYTFVL